MSVQVRLLANFQEMAGTGQIDLDAGNVREVLDLLVDRYEGLSTELFESKDRGRLRDRVKIMVNGINIEFLEGLETELGEGDRVAVFPTIAGG